MWSVLDGDGANCRCSKLHSWERLRSGYQLHSLSRSMIFIGFMVEVIKPWLMPLLLIAAQWQMTHFKFHIVTFFETFL